MEYAEAFQVAQGYAWGHEDASREKTACATDRVASHEFATAFAHGYTLFNAQLIYSMTNTRQAYAAWQASGGQTIWSDPHDEQRATEATRKLTALQEQVVAADAQAFEERVNAAQSIMFKTHVTDASEWLTVAGVDASVIAEAARRERKSLFDTMRISLEKIDADARKAAQRMRDN